MKEKKSQAEADFPNGVAYEIFIQSWADGNGDGIGDFKGATQKLDYLQDLGISAVWLMPIMPSPSYHKYDVTDYKAIHPDYGTMEDFKIFLSEAHKRNIKVVIDMIINHTASDHPWFQEAKKGSDNPYRDYYVWADRDSIADQIAKKEVTQDSDNITQWHAVNNQKNEKHYYGFFWGGMPDLNFDNPKVRQEIYDIGRFWLDDIGVDGFRLDAAKHIFPDDRLKDSYKFWQEYRDEMRKIKPDVYLVGEVWSSSEIVKEFAKGLPALFNFDLAGSIQQSVIQGKNVAATIEGPKWVNLENEDLISRLIKQREVFKSATDDYQDAIFLSNHDQNRVMSNFKGDITKAKTAASILLTLPGTPYIYYGEEIGMLGKKPDPNIREPFLWIDANSDTLRTSWMDPEFTSDETVGPVSQQEENANSLLNHYKKWIHLRNHNELLTKGSIEEFENQNRNLLAFTRAIDDEKLHVIHNLSSKSQTLKVSPKTFVYGQENLDNGKLKASQSIIFK
ncbi:alpha-amylase family glycosyl hydrolase [Marivirga harenae]|uniref:alpha-amylase family glycosyl hydrolase n=1 Tax=Marivirga harenae TaxID=2010992 RepID=UPI0026DEC17E|nr:alpha-amylase family glycosyl hydrolase [Marivirga harenae]WKV11132.1 alpha-amylase family glycosyl hydrolase [Marivirga harenae]